MCAKNRAVTRPGLLLWVVLAAGCGTETPSAPAATHEAAPARPAAITILAAASLTEALPLIAERWRSTSPDDAAATTFSFDATPRLAAQITAGAPADVFVSADTQWME